MTMHIIHRVRVAQLVQKETRGIVGKLTSRWAAEESTALLILMDQVLKTYLLEGACGVQEGVWARHRTTPLAYAARNIQMGFPEQFPGMNQQGWFALPGKPGYINLYRYLRAYAISEGKSRGLDIQRSESAASDLILRVGIRPKDGEVPVISNARKAGIEFRSRILSGESAPKDLLPYLKKIVKNQVLAFLRGRKQDETNRFTPGEDDEGKVQDPFERVRVDPDQPTLTDAVMSAFHDPNSKVGTFIRTKMREFFSGIYREKQLKRPNSPQLHQPTLKFLDMLEDPRNQKVHMSPEGEPTRRLQVPTMRDLSDQLGIESRAIEERHIKPMFRLFVEEMQKNPSIRNPLTEFFIGKGYPKEEVEDFFERDNPFQIKGYTYGAPIITVR